MSRGGGAANSSSSSSSSSNAALVYKQGIVATDDDDEEELESLSIWVRILLCPVIYPILMCYSLLTPDKSFLDEDEVCRRLVAITHSFV